MIDIQEYIDSGVLELYVYGTLSEAESVEVSRLVALHPELQTEVVRIETALQQLSSAVAPSALPSFETIRSQIQSKEGGEVIPLSRKRIPLESYFRWAAIVLLLVLMGYQFTLNQELEEKITTLEHWKK